ncbi:LytR/AlgR family response regulator transcription factor [Prevotella lacticifex]|uniref:DNA-binding response regulator n=1 Tax=Prevotella lacticifex TaxID=2854755 RepID=A0A9R1CB97_9BACT|nr:LytTR family DNA-binding domain-containing protein [Prevotella lacticifex]GJG36818.1 DNA-binding response regulator [Prevotella lacticifex]GJG38677.1 DNA-binding response regulator [Prevotella lacticifex]GJG42640.1 DNA-binding response regulator [Prevotella lacticifex]GJG45034.1 DNA-binding response regulator [Prevotella lacticifex]GJG48992.1 DNA-binding response regulator [Prevotella lacticifex]
MIRVLAIDDEPLALRQLATYIKKVEFLELAGECQSAPEAKEIMDREPIDALFIDINMPDVNGMDFVKSLDVPPLVVFTTAYSDYAVDGYKVNAVDYLLKPFSMADFRRAAAKVKEQYDLRHNEPIVLQVDSDDSIFFKTEHRIVRIKIDDIRFIEGMSEYLKIHTDGRQKPVIVLLSMKKLEDRLPKSKFMRVHRSFIINLSKIQEVIKNRVIMDEDTNIPVGDLYKDAFNSYIDSKFMGK